MKKYYFNSSLLAMVLLIVSFSFSSCLFEDEEELFQTGAAVTVADVTGLFDFVDLDNSEVGFTLDVIEDSPVNSVVIFKSYNGGEKVEHATLSSFPAAVTVTPAQAVDGLGLGVSDLMLQDDFTLSFAINMADGRTLQSATTQSIAVACVSALAGTYSVTTTYGYHDFLPDFNPNTATVEITEVSPGTYSVEDLSGGLYSVGPYSTAYTTTGIAATFTDVCDDISWSGVEDPWGDVIMTEGGVNAVDPETGVITISWTALGYGENGVSVYTPQ